MGQRFDPVYLHHRKAHCLRCAFLVDLAGGTWGEEFPPNPKQEGNRSRQVNAIGNLGFLGPQAELKVGQRFDPVYLHHGKAHCLRCAFLIDLAGGTWGEEFPPNPKQEGNRSRQVNAIGNLGFLGPQAELKVGQRFDPVYLHHGKAHCLRCAFLVDLAGGTDGYNRPHSALDCNFSHSQYKI